MCNLRLNRFDSSNIDKKLVHRHPLYDQGTKTTPIITLGINALIYTIIATWESG